MPLPKSAESDPLAPVTQDEPPAPAPAPPPSVGTVVRYPAGTDDAGEPAKAYGIVVATEGDVAQVVPLGTGIPGAEPTPFFAGDLEAAS